MENTHKTDGKTSTPSMGVTEMQKLNQIMTEIRDLADYGKFSDYQYALLIVAQDRLRKLKNMLPKVIRCFHCNEEVFETEAVRWYHADQDDLVCKKCGKELKHHDTAYAGKPVWEGE